MNLLKLSYPNIKYLQKPTAIIILNNETLKTLVLISRIRQRYPLSTLLLNIVLSVSDVSHSKKWWIEFYETDNLSSVKGTVKRMKRQCTGWEKLLPNAISNKRLVSGIYKDFLKLKSKKTNNPIIFFFFKWANSGPVSGLSRWKEHLWWGREQPLVTGIKSRQAEHAVPAKGQPDVQCGSPSKVRWASVREQSPSWPYRK